MDVRRDLERIVASRPARGGWIEILKYVKSRSEKRGPAPQGAGGLKSQITSPEGGWNGPAPQGAGGLKSGRMRDHVAEACVPPRKGRVD